MSSLFPSFSDLERAEEHFKSFPEHVIGYIDWCEQEIKNTQEYADGLEVLPTDNDWTREYVAKTKADVPSKIAEFRNRIAHARQIREEENKRRADIQNKNLEQEEKDFQEALRLSREEKVKVRQPSAEEIAEKRRTLEHYKEWILNIDKAWSHASASEDIGLSWELSSDYVAMKETIKYLIEYLKQFSDV